MIDLISDEEGPFSPERTGGLPTFQTLKLAAESGKSFKELYNYVKKQGGLMGHLGTNDGREVERRIADGDEHAALVYEPWPTTLPSTSERWLPWSTARWMPF